ncbi:MAG: dihydropteridine reductase [Clostridia bacterium]|nr:dihydropteridine reductase [Clostridia bacterium]
MNRNDQQFMAQKIRAQYMEKESSELDVLRRLDARVKRPADVLAYVLGSISAIIMGAGMSLVMTDIGATLGIKSAMVSGIVIGIVGMLMAIANYPIYRRILGGRRKKYSAEILELSNKIMNKEKCSATDRI